MGCLQYTDYTNSTIRQLMCIYHTNYGFNKNRIVSTHPQRASIGRRHLTMHLLNMESSNTAYYRMTQHPAWATLLASSRLISIDGGSGYALSRRLLRRRTGGTSYWY